jgi:hypothetical protein
MKSLAVAAGAIHGLSLAVAYGGPVFAKVGLKRALRKVSSKNERRAAMQTAWSQFSKVNVPAHVGFTASWLILRSMLRQAKLDNSTKNLLMVKDVLIAGALVTGVAATITGKALKRAQRASTSTTKPTEAEKPVTHREKPAHKAERSTSGKQFKKLLRLEKKLGRANMAFLAGAIIISPAIGLGIIRSQRMNILQRLFNR